MASRIERTQVDPPRWAAHLEAPDLEGIVSKLRLLRFVTPDRDHQFRIGNLLKGLCVYEKPKKVDLTISIATEATMLVLRNALPDSGAEYDIVTVPEVNGPDMLIGQDGLDKLALTDLERKLHGAAVVKSELL